MLILKLETKKNYQLFKFFIFLIIPKTDFIIVFCIIMLYLYSLGLLP